MRKNVKLEKQVDTPPDPVKRRGRPKCFDEEIALEKAMLLFWQYGYEATSINDLTQALGITAPSLYSSFGGKAALFEKCLNYYLQHEACLVDEIFKKSRTAKVAIEIYLFETLKRLIQENKPVGCMLVVSTMNCSNANLDIQQQLLEKRLNNKTKIYDRLKRGQLDGDIPYSSDIRVMTDYFMTLIQGMTIQARDGATYEQLENVLRFAIQSWNMLIDQKHSADSSILESI